MIKCFTEGPKAFAKSSVCSETTIAVPACINYKCIYIFFLCILGQLPPLSISLLAQGQ